MTFMCPDNLARVMVYDDRYVFVPLLVAGLVNAYADKVLEARGGIGIKLCTHSADDGAYGVPRSPEQGGNGGLGAGQGKPCGKFLKFLCETGVVPCPRDGSRNNAMFRAHDTRHICYETDLARVPVASPP